MGNGVYISIASTVFEFRYSGWVDDIAAAGKARKE